MKRMSWTVCLLLLTANIFAAETYWPTKQWRYQDLEEAGFDKAKFKELTDWVFKKHRKWKTDSFLVIKDGYIVYEGYARGFKKGQKHFYWSWTKTLSNMLTARAIELGLLDLKTKAVDYYPSLDKEWGRDITVEHILNMSTGIRFYEEHPLNIILSDNIYTLYSKKSYDIGVDEYVTQLKNIYPPGQQFNYNTGDPNLIWGMLKRKINNKKEYDDYPWKEFFDKLGMRSITFEQDSKGTFIGSSNAWGNITDMAKVGLLMLNDGMWDGQRILPEGWVKKSVKVAPALFNPKSEKDELRLNKESYGYFLWLNKKLPMNKQRPYPAAPDDIYQAMGYRGQTMAVLPSQNIIILRMASDGRKKNRKMARNEMFKRFFASLKGGVK